MDRKGARTWDSAKRERKLDLKWPEPKVDIDTGEVTGPGPVVFYAISADASRAAISRNDGNIVIWDLASGKDIATIATGNKTDYAFALSPDGKSLAVMSKGAPRLFDSASGKETLTLPKSVNLGGGAELRFAADGKTLMLVTEGFVELWDLAKKEIHAPIKTGHRYRMDALALSPDGKTLALAAHDKKIKVIDARTGKERFELPWVSSLPASSVIFSPDGRSLASIRQSRIRIWEIPPVE